MTVLTYGDPIALKGMYGSCDNKSVLGGLGLGLVKVLGACRAEVMSLHTCCELVLGMLSGNFLNKLAVGVSSSDLALACLPSVKICDNGGAFSVSKDNAASALVCLRAWCRLRHP